MGYQGENFRGPKPDIYLKRTETIRTDRLIEHHRGVNGNVVMVTTDLGVRADALQLEEEARQRGEDVYPSGFTTLWHCDPEMGPREREDLELTAFSENLQLAAKEPPAILAVGSGSPVCDDYAGEMARRLGWAQTETLNCYLACNSGPEAFRRVMTDRRFLPGGRLEGQRVLVGGMEGLTRLFFYEDYVNSHPKEFENKPFRADNFSARVFGNGLAFAGFVPGRDFRLVEELFYAEADPGNLAAITTYNIDPEGPLIQEDGNTVKTKMPKPPDESIILMKQKPVAKMFVRAFQKGMAMLKEKYEKGIRDRRYEDKPIALTTGHHPSLGPYTLTKAWLAREWGITQEKYPWVVQDGNSSGATGPKAMNKHLGLVQQEEDIHIIQPGERFMYIGYGGGWSFSAMILERG